ncbi:MAG: fibrobacter succinogenes major paralogous domain-containing protein [Lewinellaceae bacterium]|nr:fibrobacter succinogenes major paralogous domain-containing protein [Lewinellaceae bacterium]
MKPSPFPFLCTLVLAASLSLSAQKGTVKGKSGTEYSTITIGSQVWMAENLREEDASCEDSQKISFANGSESGADAVFYDGQPHFAYHQNRPELEFGALYNLSAIRQCAVCPEGYRVPTKADWEALIEHLGGLSEAGAQLKRGGSSGFSADMMGRLELNGPVLENKAGSWWALAADGEKAYTIELKADKTIQLIEQDDKVGNYVRCIKE